jgi:predicted DCC family thiol-disulfide oxidoreductase YuxK
LNLVIYDADCGFCTKAVERLRLWVPNSFELKPYTNDLTKKVQELTGVVIEPQRYMYFLSIPDLKIEKGYDAFRMIFSLGKKTKWLSRLMELPLVPFFGRVIYRVIADNRRKLSGPNAKCGL